MAERMEIFISNGCLSWVNVTERLSMSRSLIWCLGVAKPSPSQASTTCERELPDIQAGFRKGRGTRDQIANIHWIIQKAREFQKNIYFCFIDCTKAFVCVDHKKLENSSRDRNTRSPYLPPEKPACRSKSNGYNWTWNNRLVPNQERSTSRLYIVTLLI